MTDYLLSEAANFDGIWAILKGEDDGYPFLVRMRTDLRALAGDPSLPRLLEIKWTYLLNSENVDELPTSSQQEEMEAFENTVADALHGARAALLVVVNTLQGERRWLWYCKDREKVAQVINTALRGSPAFPIRLEITSDPKWEFYLRWLKVAEPT